MLRSVIPLVASLSIAVICVVLLSKYSGRHGANADRFAISSSEDPEGGKDELRGGVELLCAASNRAVLEDILSDYRSETGGTVFVQYGSSQSLLTHLSVSGTGDLFLPADDSFLDLAKDKNLITSRISLATMQIGVAVRRDSELAVQSITDLMHTDLRFVQANPDSTAVGKLTRESLQQAELWKPVAESTLAFRGTVTEVINDLLLGVADAGIVFDAVIHPYPELHFIPVVELSTARSKVAVALTTGTKNPEAAKKFADYLASPDRGKRRYRQHGFNVLSPDASPRFGESISPSESVLSSR